MEHSQRTDAHADHGGEDARTAEEASSALRELHALLTVSARVALVASPVCNPDELSPSTSPSPSPIPSI